jgi:hypothetical protein
MKAEVLGCLRQGFSDIRSVESEQVVVELLYHP